MGVRRSQYRSLYRKLFRGSIYQNGGWFVWDIPPVHFEDGSPAMGDGVVPAICFGDFFLESLPVGSAQGGQRRSEIWESAGNGLWKGGAHRGDGPNEVPFLHELGAPAWGPAKNSGPVVESMLP